MAGIISYYICKWLDGDDSDNQPDESPGVAPPGLSSFVSLGYNLFLAIAI